MKPKRKHHPRFYRALLLASVALFLLHGIARPREIPSSTNDVVEYAPNQIIIQLNFEPADQLSTISTGDPSLDEFLGSQKVAKVDRLYRGELSPELLRQALSAQELDYLKTTIKFNGTLLLTISERFEKDAIIEGLRQRPSIARVENPSSLSKPYLRADRRIPPYLPGQLVIALTQAAADCLATDSCPALSALLQTLEVSSVQSAFPELPQVSILSKDIQHRRDTANAFRREHLQRYLLLRLPLLTDLAVASRALSQLEEVETVEIQSMSFPD